MSWIADPAFAADQPFGPQTLPYGALAGHGVAVRVGDHALPLRTVAGALGDRLAPLVSAPNLDPLLAATRADWTALRARVHELVTAPRAPEGAELHPAEDAEMLLPFIVADYVDFYSSRHHAENVSRIMRPQGAQLSPNWTRLPVGYHGRAGTVVVSGTDVPRPSGQRGADDFGPCERLDIEAEVGFVCGGPAAARVPTSAVREHVFGVCLVNDWSARDIQFFETVPLGPFLGKSFATSVSAWVTPLDALDAARVPVPPQPNPLAAYLHDAEDAGLDLALQVRCNGSVLAHPPFREMNWSHAQQLAHLTVNGARVRPGDLYASGTVSGGEPDQRGCLLELSWGGQQPVPVGSGQRTFLEDGDTVTITATAPGPSGSVVGLGAVRGTVTPGP